MFGVLIFCFGIAIYLFGVALVIPRYLLGLNAQLYVVDEWIVWYSGIPVTLGLGLTLVDLLVLMSHKPPTCPFASIRSRRSGLPSL
jgi:hypothetical protein